MNKKEILNLYRSLVKYHSLANKASAALSSEQKKLGLSYIRQEFRLNRELTEEKKINHFITQWKCYLRDISEISDASKLIKQSDIFLLQKQMSPQQWEKFRKISEK